MNTIQEKIKTIQEKIKYYNVQYYQKNKSVITDFEYDKLLKELEKLEDKYPKFAKGSPTKNVGSSLGDMFQPFKHPFPMLSLNNAMNENEFDAFLKRVNKITNNPVFTITHKMDGLAIELIYEDGILKVATTRGDGSVGEIVTNNALMVTGIKKNIPVKFDKVIIRGEVIMTNDVIKSFNEELKKNNQPLLENARNIASGGMRQKNPEITKKRKLSFVAYSLDFENRKLDHLAQLQKLDDMGFTTPSSYTHTNSISKIKEYYNDTINNRDTLNYEVDGIVIKVNDKNIQDKLGNTSRAPKFAIAWKLPSQMEITKLIDVNFQVGRTGSITPVGILKPVKIEGAVVSRVTLHNQNQVEDKDLMIGDTITVYRAGGVIPAVLGVTDKKKRNGSEKKIIFPNHCPCCDTKLGKIPHSEFAGCPNKKCFEKIYQSFQHFVSKDALNIDGLGKEILLKLIKSELLINLSDVFKISEREIGKSLNNEEGVLPKKIWDAIQKSKKTTLARFIYSLGIMGAGRTVSKIIEKKLITIDKFLNTNHSELTSIEGVGNVASNNIIDYISNKDHNDDILKMINNGLELQDMKSKTSSLSGKKILFTGKLEMPRRVMKETAEISGVIVKSSITNDLDILVAGEKATEWKVEKARDLGIEVIDEKEFVKRVK